MFVVQKVEFSTLLRPIRLLCATAKIVKGNGKHLLRRVLRGYLESKTCVQLNLTPSADSREYSAGIDGEIAR
jgi:hypothetical protein